MTLDIPYDFRHTLNTDVFKICVYIIKIIMHYKYYK